MSIFLIVMVIPSFVVVNTAWSSSRGEEDDDCCCCEQGTFFYVGRDLTTRGDWIERGYGECGYILPYAEVKGREVAIGETTGIGELAHECWWREPWSIPGEKYYPYEDYLGGKNILEYEIIGSEGPPRALVDVDSDCYRPSWYHSDYAVNVTLYIAGDYRLSIYFLDWDLPNERMKVRVVSGDYSATTELGAYPYHLTENFAGGIYAIFEVHSDSIITIEVTKLRGKYAHIAGIFLDAISSPVTGVNFAGFDRETKGNWRPRYGNNYYLLPGFNVPLSGVSYSPINKSYDETNIASENYEVSKDACQYAADDARSYGEYPYRGRYAAYAWTLPLDKTASDPRVLFYPEDKIYYGYPPAVNERIYGQWDSGELGWPLNYLIIKLKIPKGEYILSIYAMDFARVGRSETIEIWDESMSNLLDSQYITSDEINKGIYIQWFVRGPRVLNIKVIADQGNVNSFVDGIFLNCLDCYCGKTIGFWKTNILKALHGWKRGIQVSKEDIIKALDTITNLYGEGSIWGFDWLTFKGSDDRKLRQALNVLWYEDDGRNMEVKAKAQILALLLTDTHYKQHFDVIQIDWYEGGQTRTIIGWITTILYEYNFGNYEVAKDLADYLNNI